MQTVDQIMSTIFGPGTLARSELYRQGFEAVLRANRSNAFSAKCPFAPGSVDHDAWLAGAADAENFDDVPGLLGGDEGDDDDRFIFG